MTVKNADSNFLDIRTPGILGWNSHDDSSNIEDQALADSQNLQYDEGFIRPREGKTLFAEKPSGESADPLQSIGVRTSDGVKYKVVVYGNKFYLWHPDTEEWVRINQTYVPTETTLRYGYAIWNNGRGDDRLYFCNGVDNFGRWDLCVSTVSGAHTAGAATVTLVDGTRFPSGGGTLILKSSGGTFFTEAYTSRTGNVFTLTNTLDNNVDDSSSAVTDIIEKSGMELGKIVGKHQGRLFVMNYYGGETTGWYSVQTDPEDFTTGSTVPAASTFVISDGNGAITGFHDFGQFAVVVKEDSLHRIEIVIAEDLGSKLDKIQPVVSGESVGPISQASTVKVHNTLMYPTRSNGFLSLYPAGTGTDVTVERNTISQKIQPYVTKKINTDDCVGASVEQKILWTVAMNGATQNVIILMYDLERQAWSRWENIAAKDFIVEDNDLFYLDSGSGDVFQLFDNTFDDNNNPYQVRAVLKRYDFGKLSKPKTNDLMYVQGYMTPATQLYVDMFYNEEGILGKQTYLLNKDTEGLIFSAPLTNAAGEFILGQPPAGWVISTEIGNLSFFRCYLGLKISHGFFNVQPVFRSNKAAFWGITGVGFNPQENTAIPINMRVSPTTTEV